ncbi:MAG: hypothetical protein ABR552_09330 [Actinomycetota bacterium]|nr:hypothetical protein [Actinomycetota bacterium]
MILASATSQIGGPAIVFALVLAEIAVGGIAVLWLVPAWGNVRDAFFKLAGGVLAACAVFAWLAARAPLRGADTRATILLAAFAASAVVWQLLLWAGARSPSRLVGMASSPVGVAAFIVLSANDAVPRSAFVAAFQLLAGALVMGAVVDGLLLGHWHLVDRKAAKAPLERINYLFLAGCAAAAAAVLLGGTGAGVARSDLSPLLGVGVLTVSIAVGMMALCALIGSFIRALIKEDSMQSATGLFYLGVIMAVAGEFAAKVRFF